MIKRNFSYEIMIIAILFLTVTFLWVYLTVYHALDKSEKPILKPKEIQILNPQLDTEVFDQLERKKI